MAKQRAEHSDPRIATEIDRQIGARVRARRLELRMSQEGLADEIGVTFQQIQKYERGINRVSAATLYRIARALNVDVAMMMPRMKGSGAAATNPVDDPLLAEMLPALARLNAAGRLVVLELARSLGSHPTLSAKRKAKRR